MFDPEFYFSVFVKNLFEINIENRNQIAAYANDENIDKWKLWHLRLGHLSIDNMKKIRSEDVQFKEEKYVHQFCKSCALGKSTKLPHKSINEKSNKQSDHIIIHSDLVGPMRTESLGSNAKYILTYLCNQTEFSSVYLLKEKSEQLDKFKEFKSYYELLTNKKIKELRTDNGGEYMSIEFYKYLKENGIKHNTSVPYCPQSNGKAERLNRTIIEKARCMLITAKLDNNLWGAAINTANYLRNISPSVCLDGKSPYQALYRKIPKIGHLKVFGCEACPLYLNERTSKFDPVA